MVQGIVEALSRVREDRVREPGTDQFSTRTATEAANSRAKSRAERAGALRRIYASFRVVDCLQDTEDRAAQELATALNKRDAENRRLREQRDQINTELGEHKARAAGRGQAFNECKILLEARTASLSCPPTSLVFMDVLLAGAHEGARTGNLAIEGTDGCSEWRQGSYELLFPYHGRRRLVY